MTVGTRDLPAFLDSRPRRAVLSAPVLTRTGSGHVPGEAGLWIFLLGDMTLFGLFFVGFVVQMSGRPDQWAASADRLHDDLGMMNTVILLVSSYLIARAVAAWRSNRFGRARALMLTAAALGACFFGTKLAEYALLAGEGVSPVTDLFFTYYFVLTGIHLLHVVIGVAILLICARRIGHKTARSIEGSAAYWHMVDVLWVVLFPLLYFVGRL